MGFTHYFETKKEIPELVWNKEFTPAVMLLIEEADVPIVGVMGDAGTEPHFGDNRIAFNGLGDDSHETMEINRLPNNFYFCKTNHKPYDKVCVAVAIVAATLYPDCFSWSSDGGDPKTDLEFTVEGKQLIGETFHIKEITHGNLVEAIKERWKVYLEAHPVSSEANS